jgi:type I restriction enzyme S subunit
MSKFLQLGSLPEGWTVAALGDGLALDVQQGFACGAHTRDLQDIPHLRPMNVSQDGRIDLSNLKLVPKEQVDRDERRLRSGDVLFNNTNSPELVGKTAYYDRPEPRAFSNHMTRIRCHGEALDPRYCAFVLHTKWMDGHFESICNNHVSQASISRTVLLDTRIPLPPLAEQRRIVAKVEALLARVSGARQRLTKVPPILKRFRLSVLAVACSGRLTADWRTANRAMETRAEMLIRVRDERYAIYKQECNLATLRGRTPPRKPPNLDPREEPAGDCLDIPTDWAWMTVQNICSARSHAMSSGPFGSALGTKDYTDSGVPVIRGQNIERGRFLVKNLVYVSEGKADQLSRSVAYPGDIVIIAVGVGAGESAIVPHLLARAVLSQNCNKLTVDHSIVLPEFVILLLQMQMFFRGLQERATDTARPFLSLTNIKSVVLPVPPLPEQHEIVRRVDALFRLADAIEKRVVAATARAEKLTQAILAKAFRAELVPTEAELARREGRSYEPASALLQRIQALRVEPRERPKPGPRKII